MRRTARRLAFTLVELLVVISILVLLMGMLMPILSMARREADRSATRSLLIKIDAAVQQFKADVGVFPYQANPATASGPWRNRLLYYLAADADKGFPPAPAPDRTVWRGKLDADLAAISAAYAGSTYGIAPTAVAAADARINNAYTVYKSGVGNNGRLQTDPVFLLERYAGVINGLASERGRMLLLSGNPQAILGFGSNGAVLPTPASVLSFTEEPDSGPNATVKLYGWRGDYLSGDLKPGRDYRLKADGSPATYALLDRWGTELVYIAPITPSVSPRNLGQVAFRIGRWGVGDVTFPSIEPSAFGLGGSGRDQVAITPTDPVTTHAVPAYARRPEIWSAGPNRAFDAVRSASVNRDNLAHDDDCRKGLR